MAEVGGAASEARRGFCAMRHIARVIPSFPGHCTLFPIEPWPCAWQTQRPLPPSIWALAQSEAKPFTPLKGHKFPALIASTQATQLAPMHRIDLTLFDTGLQGGGSQ